MVQLSSEMIAEQEKKHKSVSHNQDLMQIPNMRWPKQQTTQL